MADRTETKKECDKGACRKKVGVCNIRITVETWPIGADAPVVSVGPELPEGSTHRTYKGELCPPHTDLAHRQAAALFINTKAYPES